MNIDPRILKGFRDFLPKEMILRERMLSRIKTCFERHGFSPISTPALEYSEILTGKYGEECDKLLYKFADHGGRDVALRYDLTVPLARMIGLHRDLVLPFKRYQIAEVWRAEKPGRGRFREFIQCDADIVGSNSPLSDAEVISAGIDALLSIGLTNFTVRINHMGIMNAFLFQYGIREKNSEILRALDKFEKIGLEGVNAELKEISETLDETVRQKVLSILKINERFSDNKDLILFLKNELRESPSGLQSIENLEEIVNLVNHSDFGSFIKIDLSIARGLDYYTGAVFETRLNDLQGFGSIMSGGRYDGLIGIFAGREIPAVGISIGLDRLFSALVELGKVDSQETVTKVMICVAGKEAVPQATSITRRLRDAGVNAEIHHDPSEKIGKQISSASKKGIPYVMIIGEKEIQDGKCSLKELASGEQSYLTVEEAIAALLH